MALGLHSEDHDVLVLELHIHDEDLDVLVLDDMDEMLGLEEVHRVRVIERPHGVQD